MNQKNTIVNGDCVEVMPRLASQSVAFVLTDPPYLVRYQSRDGRRLLNDDNDRWLRPAFAEAYRVLENDSFCVSFYGWPSADRFIEAFRHAGFRVVGHLAFAKRYASSVGYLRYRHECAFLLVKGNPARPSRPLDDVRDWAYSGNRLHPTQKPVEVLLPLVESFSRPGGLVLDPFAGSGSTLVAANDAGRDFFGIELDRRHYETACRRMDGRGGDVPEAARATRVGARAN